jgi:hypothetical protein
VEGKTFDTGDAAMNSMSPSTPPLAMTLEAMEAKVVEAPKTREGEVVHAVSEVA